MIKGSETRKADHPIDTLFLDRWSPRAMSGEEIAEKDLMVLFEAARWAPSSSNNQPWRILYARRQSVHWPLFFDLLVEANKVWCRNAAALLCSFQRRRLTITGSHPSRTRLTPGPHGRISPCKALSKDIVHGMQGFDYDRAKTALGIPEGSESGDGRCGQARPKRSTA